MKKDPKDPKVSLRNKYNRRVRALRHTLDDFLYHAEMRLNESKAGRIYRRARAEAIVAKCEELAKLLPEPDAHVDNLIFPDILTFLDENAKETERILKDGEKFLKSLSEEDWAEIRKYARKRT